MELPSDTERPPLKVIFSERAKADLDRIARQLTLDWSATVSVDFLSQIVDRLRTLGRFPFAYPASDRYPGLRQCVIGRRTVLYYLVTTNYVEIAFLHDTRADAPPR